MIYEVSHGYPGNEADRAHQPDLFHDLPARPKECRIDAEQEEAEDHGPAVGVEVLVGSAGYHDEERSLQELAPIRHGGQFRVVNGHSAPSELSVGKVSQC